MFEFYKSIFYSWGILIFGPVAWSVLEDDVVEVCKTKQSNDFFKLNYNMTPFLFPATRSCLTAGKKILKVVQRLNILQLN